jgi:hypothetical protein
MLCFLKLTGIRCCSLQLDCWTMSLKYIVWSCAGWLLDMTLNPLVGVDAAICRFFLLLLYVAWSSLWLHNQLEICWNMSLTCRFSADCLWCVIGPFGASLVTCSSLLQSLCWFWLVGLGFLAGSGWFVCAYQANSAVGTLWNLARWRLPCLLRLYLVGWGSLPKVQTIHPLFSLGHSAYLFWLPFSWALVETTPIMLSLLMLWIPSVWVRLSSQLLGLLI